MTKLPRSFYARGAVEVARDLLGKTLVRRLPEGLLSGRIVETEAYTGQTDPGSHAYGGKTTRNAVMFGPPGFVYVYFIYGMHYCMNVVTDDPATAGAVLLRALQPLEGAEIMQENRGRRQLLELCNGPAKLCQALRITLAENGLDLDGTDLWIEDQGCRVDCIATTTRVGLSAGQDLPYRFFIEDNPFVSPGRPSGT